MFLRCSGSEGKEDSGEKRKTKPNVTFLHARTRVVILAEGDGENLSTCSRRLRPACCKPWMEAHSGAWNWPSMGSEEAVPSPAVSRTSPRDGPGPLSPAVTERRTQHQEDGVWQRVPAALLSRCGPLTGLPVVEGYFLKLHAVCMVIAVS